MTRIVTLVVVCLALVGGGVWLANRQTALSQTDTPPTAPSAPTEPPPGDPESVPNADTGAAAEESLYIPDGYTLIPFLSDTPTQSFREPEQVTEPDTDYAAVLQTNKGTLVINLYQDDTPETVNNFVFLARHRYYDGIVFHRVLDDFMAQTGDPTGTGSGGPGYQFGDEIVSGLSHDRAGILSMANAGPGTNGSQFFITFQATPWLNGAHTMFGQVIEGLELLDTLQRVDPTQPSAIGSMDDTLASLEEQDITLAGDADGTLQGYLEATLGSLPDAQQNFSIDGYSAVLAQPRDGSGTSGTVVGFWPRPDFIERAYIVARPAETSQEAP